MKKVSLLIFAAMLAGAVGLTSPMVAYAEDEDSTTSSTKTEDTEFAKGVCSDPNISEDLKKQAGCKVEEGALSNTAVNLINIVIAIIGLVAVVVVVIGGIQYAISLGDPGKITQAKNMILYGVIAVIVAIAAWGIVQFVVASVPSLDAGTDSTTSSGAEDDESDAGEDV